jgi:hypothetical protein
VSLYNLLHGVNPFAPLLLALVGVRIDEVPRFRDVFLTEREPGEFMVVLHTRTGGGNREDYQVENEALALKPTYLRDEDDDFDCTYANFFFRVPAELQATVQEIAGIGGAGEEPRVAWERVLTKLRDHPADSPDEEVRNAMEVGRPIVANILEALNQPAAPAADQETA